MCDVDGDHSREAGGRGPLSSQAVEKARPDLTIVICTRDRPESLGLLLDSLANQSMADIRVDVVVVDNCPSESARPVVESHAARLPIRYLREARPGKCHALNRALDEGGLGDILAFLDDDMTLHPGWVSGVKAGCDRWPDHDIFSGRSYVVFPEGEDIPEWARNRRIEGWAFSVADPGEGDSEMSRGFFPSGNHFWLRARALETGRRFPALWLLAEAALVLRLYDEGRKGAWIGDVVAGHRIQAHLLSTESILLRMGQFGKDFPYARMPNPNLFWQARLFRRCPPVSGILFALNALRWKVRLLASCAIRDRDRRLERRLIATMRLADSVESFVHWPRIRRFVRDGQRTHTQSENAILARLYGIDRR